MIPLLLFLVLVFGCLAAVFAIAGGWMHRSYYENPIEGLAWRAPAAAGILTAFLGLAAWLNSRAPGRFESPFQFTLIDSQEFDQFWTEKKSDTGTVETLFRRRTVPPGRVEYVDATGRRFQRSDSGVVQAIIVEENGVRQRFEAKLDKDGNFLRDPSDRNRTLDVEYIEVGGRGRVMSESTIGQITTTRLGGLIVVLFFNLVHLVLWIIVIGLFLELSWPHAIFLGFVGWLVVLLLVWPPLKSRVPPMQAPAPVEESPVSVRDSTIATAFQVADSDL